MPKTGLGIYMNKFKSGVGYDKAHAERVYWSSLAAAPVIISTNSPVMAA